MSGQSLLVSGVGDSHVILQTNMSSVVMCERKTTILGSYGIWRPAVLDSSVQVGGFVMALTGFIPGLIQP